MRGSIDEIVTAFDDTAPLARAATLPASWYTDPRIADLERRGVWHGRWQVAGRADLVAAPGQYLTTDIAGEPIVVVRGRDGVLRAFFNVCRHHAAAVCTAPEGRADRLRCPYHGWVYGLDGALRSAPELDGVEGFDPAENGLVPVAVGTWEKFVFVNVAPDPEPLEAHLGGLRARVAGLGLDRLHFAARREWTLACNWKVFVDNYLDGGYHVPHLHRGLSSVLRYSAYTVETFDRACLQASPLVPGGDADVAAVRQGNATYAFLYPNFMLNHSDGCLDTNLVVPLGLDRTRVIFDFYFADVGEAARARNAESMSLSDRIQAEDHAICESVQRGLGSRAYGKGRLSVRREAGENLFHRLLAADVKAALAALRGAAPPHAA